MLAVVHAISCNLLRLDTKERQMTYNLVGHEEWVIQEATKREQDRIIGILRQDLCDNPDCAATYQDARCQMVEDLIRRIEGRDIEA